MKFIHLIGFIVGIIMTITPEAFTSVIGVAIVGYTAYKIGWLGKG